MRATTAAPLLALALLAGCKSEVGRPAPPPPPPKLPNFGGMADQIVSWLPDGAAVTLAYMDLAHLQSIQGKAACEDIRATYPDRMDVYLANAARMQHPKRITVVDRRDMAHYLAEQKLQASDMVPFDPASRVKLKKIRAVNTYVYWKVTREGDIEEWVLRAVGVETGEVYGGLVHRFRLPEELRAQPRLGDLTVDAFGSLDDKAQFRLALQGNPAACVFVGDRIEDERVSKPELYDPLPWYVRAGEAGYAEGYYRAGMLFYEPVHRHRKRRKVKNWATARKWFEKAAELGHVKALTTLGWMHHRGEGTPIDDAKAREYYLQAARGGDATAMNQIGYLLDVGLGGDVDLKRAAHWYRQGADNGNGVAAMNLGKLYQKGRGVKQDELAAVRWYRKSAWANCGRGMTCLALMYEQGRGVPKNLKKAQEWLRKARKNGSRTAYDHLVRVDAELWKQERARKAAAKRRLAEVRAATWVVIPHTLKMYDSTSYSYRKRTAILKQGERLHVLALNVSGSGGKFDKVLYQGQEGYVRTGLLKMLDPKQTPTTLKTAEKKGKGDKKGDF